MGEDLRRKVKRQSFRSKGRAKRNPINKNGSTEKTVGKEKEGGGGRNRGDPKSTRYVTEKRIFEKLLSEVGEGGEGREQA